MTTSTDVKYKTLTGLRETLAVYTLDDVNRDDVNNIPRQCRSDVDVNRRGKRRRCKYRVLLYIDSV